MSDGLPRGWTNYTLAEIGQWRSGGTPSRKKTEFFGKGVPWVKSGDLKDGLILKTEEEITKLGLENSSAKLMPVGTISMALYGATIGRLGLLTFPAATNQACANVIPDNHMTETKYLFFYLLSERRNFINQGQGGAQPNISQEIVLRHPIPLAPLAEQRRIVAKLEALLDKVDACQKRLEKIPVLLKRFRQSVLAAACSGRLTEDWRKVRGVKDDGATEPLGKVFTMRNGKSLTQNKRQKGNIPVYGGNGYMGTHSSSNADGKIIVIGRVGAQCGNVHYVIGKAWVTDNAISLEANKEIDPAYYAYFLRSKNINQLSGGTGQPYVSQEILAPIETPIVSLDEQQEIVHRIEALLKIADQIETRYKKSKSFVDKLTQSILAKAFRGELVEPEQSLNEVHKNGTNPA